MTAAAGMKRGQRQLCFAFGFGRMFSQLWEFEMHVRTIKQGSNRKLCRM